MENYSSVADKIPNKVKMIYIKGKGIRMSKDLDGIARFDNGVLIAAFVVILLLGFSLINGYSQTGMYKSLLLPKDLSKNGMSLKFRRLDSASYKSFKLPNPGYISDKCIIERNGDSLELYIRENFGNVIKLGDTLIISRDFARNIYILNDTLHYYFRSEGFYRNTKQKVFGVVINKNIILLEKEEHIEFYYHLNNYIYSNEFNQDLSHILTPVRGEGYIDGYLLINGTNETFISDKLTDVEISWINDKTVFIKRHKYDYINKKHYYDYIKLNINDQN